MDHGDEKAAEQAVTIIRDKVVKHIDEAKSNVDVNAALEKQKELNKKLIDKLKQAKSALVKKAETAKVLAKKAKDAVEAATNKDGELAKKLHEAAAKVAEKAK